MKRMMCCLVLAACASAPAVLAQSSYTEGAVLQIASIRVEFGHMDKYMDYLANEWQAEQEALKAAGIILDYDVYETDPRSPDAPNVYLVTTYANMAAFDGLDARSDAAIKKASGESREQDQKGMADRNSYRRIISIETVRERKLK